MSEFDEYAGSYAQVLDTALAPTGESSGYYAAKRVQRLADHLMTAGITAAVGLDFGCGVGGTIPLLKQALNLQRVIGLDVSRDCLAEAERRHRDSDSIEIIHAESLRPECCDLAYINGVFHHILPEARQTAAEAVYGAIRPGGWLALWENNPWNPGTRYLMKRTPFDQDVIPMSPLESRALMRHVGFQILITDYLFLFPRRLRYLRLFERGLLRLPIGGQYLIFCQKPG